MNKRKKLIMIHGMCVSAWCWDKFREYYEKKDYDSLTPILRFHDMPPERSPDQRLGSISLLDYVEDMQKELLQLPEKPIIIGHSMGGLIGQILAERQLVKALILLTPASPSGYLNFYPSQLKTFLSVQKKWGYWHKPWRFTFNETAYGILNLLPPAQQREIYQKFVFESGRALAEIAFWFFDTNRSARVDESKVNCPVLVIGAANDRITPVAVTRKIAFKYRHVATYQQFNSNAHWVMGEPGWEKIAGFIHDWLDKEVFSKG
jgi:pimeloyl-ACP methyl ester carboxylesterase